MEHKQQLLLPSIHQWKMDPFSLSDIPDDIDVTEEELLQPPSAVDALFAKMMKAKGRKENGFHHNQDSTMFTFRRPEFNQLRKEMIKLHKTQEILRGLFKESLPEPVRQQEELKKLIDRSNRDQELIKMLQTELSRLRSEYAEVQEKLMDAQSRKYSRSSQGSPYDQPIKSPNRLMGRASGSKSPKPLDADKRLKPLPQLPNDPGTIVIDKDKVSQVISLKGAPVSSALVIHTPESISNYICEHPYFLDVAWKQSLFGMKVELGTAVSAWDDFQNTMHHVMTKSTGATRASFVSSLQRQISRLGTLVNFSSSIDVGKRLFEFLDQISKGINHSIGGCFSVVYCVDVYQNQFYITGCRNLCKCDDEVYLCEDDIDQNDARHVPFHRIDIGSGIVTQTLEAGHLLYVSSTADSLDFDPRSDLVDKESGSYSVLSIPIVLHPRKRAVAIIQVYRKCEFQRFYKEDEVLLQIAAILLKPYFALLKFSDPDSVIENEEENHPHIGVQGSTISALPLAMTSHQPSMTLRSSMAQLKDVDLRELYGQLQDSLRAHLSFDRCDLYVYEYFRDRTFLVSINDGKLIPSTPVCVPQIGKNKIPSRFSALSDIPGFDYAKEDLHSCAPGSVLYVPFFSERGLVGVCRLLNRREQGNIDDRPEDIQPFTIDDERLATEILLKLGSSFGSVSRLFIFPDTPPHTTVSTDENAMAMVQTALAICEPINMESMRTVVLTEISRHFSAQVYGFYTFDKHNNKFVGKEVVDSNIHDVAYDAISSLIGRIAAEGKSCALLKPYESNRFEDCEPMHASIKVESSLTVPVRSDAGTIAVIHIINKGWDKQSLDQSGRHFDEADLKKIEIIASFCAVSMRYITFCLDTQENKVLLNEQIRKLENTIGNNELLLSTARHIYDTMDPEEVTRKIMHKAQQIVNADRCALFLIDREQGELYTTVAAGLAKGGVLRFPMTEGLAGHVATTGASLNIEDAHEDKRFNRDIDKKTGYRTKSLLCMPIKHHGQVIGVCQMLNKKNAQGDIITFDRNDESLFESFSVFAGLSLKNATMHKSIMDAQAQAEQNLKRSQRLQEQQKIIMEMATNISQNLSTTKVITTIMDEARKLVVADRCSLFLVDKKKQELYSKMASGVDQLRIPMNRGLAGHVATTGEILNIRDAYEDTRFNRAIDLKTGYHTKTILCMPIRHGSEIIGVAQMVNKANGEFTEEDEFLFEAFSVFCGISLRNASLYEAAVAARKQLKSLLEITLTLSGEQDVSTMLRSIMNRVQQFVESDDISAYALDDKQPAVIVGYDSEGNQHQKNLRDGSKHSRMLELSAVGGEIVKEDVQETGQTTIDQSYLLVPIRSSVKKVAGVIELVKKRKGGFTRQDQDLVEAFATFCGVHIKSGDVEQTGSKDDDEAELSLDYYESKYRAGEAMLTACTDWNFEFWECTHDDLIGMMFFFFEDLGLMKRFHLSKLHLYRFLRAISLRYNKVIYHNFQHAFMVTHSVYWFLRRIDRDNYLGDLQTLGLLIAAICHDVDHRGTNNSFQVNANTPLAMLYGTSSVMENHHCSVAIHVLTQEENDILASLSKEDAPVVWKTIINTILSTDLARYGQHMKKLDDVVTKGYDRSQVDHMQLACDTLLAGSDIANITKRFDVAEKWSHIVVSEMFAQGEVETKLGLQHATPPPTKELAELQIGFYNAFGVPLYNQVARLFPELKFLAIQCDDNRQRWVDVYNHVKGSTS
eukprot:TRINITY_DN11342_c0_g1_i1.p1 TRINITY_DN11342_c0_g1~~TRINITY_DN11342_c0_g1_i1.p1  ORF type:complete len:1723 (+),score=337.99 TRINITY_DN11342_c0_g1_i1:146-5314(+)